MSEQEIDRDRGDIAGKYRLREKIGSGATADVYLAEYIGDHGFRRLVAVKRIRSAFVHDEHFITSLIDEARLGGQLSHPNIVQTFEFLSDAGSYFLAMEYVGGVTLARLLDHRHQLKTPLPLPICLEIARNLCAGLAYAHQATDLSGTPLRMIHRDLKPANILLSTFGAIKIGDFGVAKAVSNMHQTTDPESSAKGTLRYMSPEQASSAVLDHRSDLYSLGAILFEMLTLEQLYPNAVGIPGLGLVSMGRVHQRLKLLEDRPVQLQRVVRRLLAADREERYSKAEEVKRDLWSVPVEAQPVIELGELVRDVIERGARSKAPSLSGGHHRNEQLAPSSGGSSGLTLDREGRSVEMPGSEAAQPRFLPDQSSSSQGTLRIDGQGRAAAQAGLEASPGRPIRATGSGTNDAYSSSQSGTLTLSEALPNAGDSGRPTERSLQVAAAARATGRTDREVSGADDPIGSRALEPLAEDPQARGASRTPRSRATWIALLGTASGLIIGLSLGIHFITGTDQPSGAGAREGNGMQPHDRPDTAGRQWSDGSASPAPVGQQVSSFSGSARESASSDTGSESRPSSERLLTSERFGEGAPLTAQPGSGMPLTSQQGGGTPSTAQQGGGTPSTAQPGGGRTAGTGAIRSAATPVVVGKTASGAAGSSNSGSTKPPRTTGPGVTDSSSQDAGATGSLWADANPYAYVAVDGHDLGVTTPLLGYPLPAGPHTLVFRSSAGGGEKTFQVTIKPGQELRLDGIRFADKAHPDGAAVAGDRSPRSPEEKELP